MMTPQDITAKTYQENFDMYKEKTPNEVSGEYIAWMDDFVQLLPQHGSVLEIGSAQGRDARYLRDRDFMVTCTDIIPQAVEALKLDNFKTDIYDFRNEPKKEWVDSFDGVFAKAVYLHAIQDVFEKSFASLSQVLKVGGIFCLTFKLGEGEEIETDKLGGDRYFKYYSKSELEAIIKKYQQYELLSMCETSDGKWVQLLVRRV